MRGVENVKATIATAALALAPVAHGTEPQAVSGFLCVPDYATGYSRESGDWRPVQFDVTGKRYLFILKNDQWFWTEFGKEPNERSDRCSAPDDGGFSECKSREGQVVLNKNTLRFQVVQKFGYVIGDLTMEKVAKFTPFYEIGKCSPL
jgi:hypothetical protein